jgi:hypothetical protein
MQGLPANDVAIISRELLPHVFTLARRSFSEGGQLFSVALSVNVMLRQAQHDISRLFTGALLCAVQTFLPPV